LLKINDISSALAVHTGLESLPVSRLKRTWEELGDDWTAQRNKISEILTPDRNYKQLRQHISYCDPPLVPFIGLYLKDLTFIEDGNPTVTTGDLINFEKCTMLSNIIQLIQQYQLLGFHLIFRELPPFQEWIATWTLQDDEALFQRSLLLEPRVLTWSEYEKLLLQCDRAKGLSANPRPKRQVCPEMPKQKSVDDLAPVSRVLSNSGGSGTVSPTEPAPLEPQSSLETLRSLSSRLTTLHRRS
jgi:hypothetical protein